MPSSVSDPASMRMFLTPKWWLSHLFVATMLVVMTAAGFWQLDRLSERRASNDEIRAASEADPVPVEQALDRVAAGETVLDHTAVTVRGTFRGDLGFLVANRTFDTQPGSWLAAPMELDDGRLIIVSRGWVPRRWVVGDDPRSADPPTGTVVIEGRLFESIDGGRIGTGTDTLAEVSRMELETVEEALGVDLADRWVQLSEPQAAFGEIPVPVPPPNLNDGPHLSYAFQWFFFTVSTVVAYGLIFRHRLRDARIEDQALLDLSGQAEESGVRSEN
ncbi:MAG: SURF1 family protein [Actinomycetota bacterium]